MFLSPSQVQAIEAAAFERGVQAETLMEIAGKGIAKIVRQFHPNPGCVVAWGGKGNNAGDVLVAARILAEWGWKAEFCCAFPETLLRKLPAKKLTEFRNTNHLPHRATLDLRGAGSGSNPARDGRVRGRRPIRDF